MVIRPAPPCPRSERRNARFSPFSWPFSTQREKYSASVNVCLRSRLRLYSIGVDRTGNIVTTFAERGNILPPTSEHHTWSGSFKVLDGRIFLHSWLNARRSSHLASDDSAPPKAHIAANKNTRSMFCADGRRRERGNFDLTLLPHTRSTHECGRFEADGASKPIDRLLPTSHLVQLRRVDLSPPPLVGVRTQARSFVMCYRIRPSTRAARAQQLLVDIQQTVTSCYSGSANFSFTAGLFKDGDSTVMTKATRWYQNSHFHKLVGVLLIACQC